MNLHLQHYLALIGAGLLAVSASLGSVAAQTGDPVNADGAYVVANDDGAPIVSGAGDDIYYGDINTGGRPSEVLGDPSAVYSPNVPEPGGGVPVIAGAGDGLIGGVPIRPAAPDTTTMTTTTLASTDGTATENIPVDAVAPTESAPAAAESAPVATDTATTGGGFCSRYATWYDAQIAYENLGATAADPVLVQEIDPNYDGIACEAMMV
ncbi:MAG: hypothetical protein KY456_03500 [Chloroflexi bacterium]|nr:hypothetical protein [Chloroflexota bacterium]